MDTTGGHAEQALCRGVGVIILHDVKVGAQKVQVEAMYERTGVKQCLVVRRPQIKDLVPHVISN
jgi:hypothetical protein